MKRLGITIIKREQLYYRICPSCNKELSYKNYDSSLQADQRKNICRDCARPDTHGSNNPMFGKRHSLDTIKKISDNHKGKPLLHLRKRPFEWCYNKLNKYGSRKNIINYITYEEFVAFTKIDKCHYCEMVIQWNATSKRGINHGYNLDRKNNKLGYTKDNCIVCCGDCNRIKLDRMSYNLMVKIGKLIKQERLDNVLQ